MKIEIKLKEGERIDNALRRFRKVVEKSGILQELRKREYFEKPSVKAKRKQAASLKRAKRNSRG
jgi:small subunit ribosomal protein S21